MLMDNRLDQFLGTLRGSAQIPLRLELWNGRHFDLMPNPTVTISVPRPSALRYLFPTDIRRLLADSQFTDVRIYGGFDEREFSKDDDELVVEARTGN